MKVLFLLTSILMSASAFSLEWGNWTKIREIYTQTDSGSPYIQMVTDNNPMPGCHGNSGGYLKGTDIDKAYSAVLAALLSNRQVRPLYEINTEATGWSQCYIKSIYIR